jgi:hypothetical protein
MRLPVRLTKMGSRPESQMARKIRVTIPSALITSRKLASETLLRFTETPSREVTRKVTG